MTATHWFMIGLVVVVAVFDVYADRAKDLPTISQAVWVILRKHPILAFALGVVCGHLFWQE